MSSRVATPGKTRICPHCKATILESASICPGCNHHLRFDAQAIVDRRAQPTFSALRVEGAFRNQEGADAWEYSVGTPGRPGAGIFPRAVTLALAAFGLIVLLNSVVGLIRRRRDAERTAQHESAEPGEPQPARNTPVLLFGAAVLSFVALFSFLGFLLSGAISATLASRAFQDGRRPWWRAPVIGIGLALAFEVVFREAFRVNLPAGSLGISTAELFG